MWIRKIVSGTVVVLISGTAAAQGAFDFDDIPGVDQEPAVSLDVNSVVLGFIREAARQADPATADLLDGLRSIRLRVYHDGENASLFNSFIDNVAEELEDSGWLPVMEAQDEGSKVSMHMQMTEQEVSGMTVMASDGSEAIFINIDGTVSAADLGRVLAALPVEDALGAFGLPSIVPAPAPQPTVDGATD